MMREYRYMEGITSLAKFRNVIQTCNFWGETWTVSTLERILNIKLIILSSEAYDRGDYHNVIQCGQLNDTILESKGVFKPTYYIMTDWLGWHYKSIAYKNKKMLRFEEIPYGIKELIVNKCLERMAGPYSIIPKFVALKKAYDARIIEEIGETESELEEDLTTESSKDSKEGLFREDVVFQFYKKSQDKSPGKGAGETIPDDVVKEYTALSKYKHWRRTLSNFAITPFKLDGHTWSSIEHYIQAKKFERTNPKFYLEFTQGSTTELGKLLSNNPDMAKAAGSIKGIYKGQKIRPEHVKFDISVTSPQLELAMDKALDAKFKQNEESKNVLLATNDAMLMVYIHKRPALPFFNIMKLRNEMKEKTKETVKEVTEEVKR